MFSGTIAENMRNVKQDATDEEIIEALKLACAWDFVEKLPDGIESIVKERAAVSPKVRHRGSPLPEHYCADHRSCCWMRLLPHWM